MKKKKIIIAMWILISVLMPILYLSMLSMRPSEYDKVIKEYIDEYKSIHGPIEKPPPIPLKIMAGPTLIDVLVITVFELVSITGLTIFISKKDKTDYQKQIIT